MINHKLVNLFSLYLTVCLTFEVQQSLLAKSIKSPCYNSQTYHFILMDVRKHPFTMTDAISCVQCCSVLVDHTNLSPKAAGILVSSFSSFSVLQHQYTPCFPPAPSPGCHHLSVAPQISPMSVTWLKGFFCASPQILEQEADTGQNKPTCICCQQQDQLLGIVLRQTKVAMRATATWTQEHL